MARHKWKPFSGGVYRCSVCKEMDQPRVDWCDSDGRVREMNRIKKRNDCKGSRRK